MARCSLQDEILRQAALGRIDTFHLSDLFDKELQRNADHGSIQNGSSNRRWQSDFAYLSHQPARKRSQRADGAFGQRENVLVM